MEQYYSSEPDIVLGKDGSPIKVSHPRTRLKYTSKGSALVRDKENIRVDSLADRLVGGIRNVGRIIDCNEVDVLSLNNGDTVYYAKGQ